MTSTLKDYLITHNPNRFVLHGKCDLSERRVEFNSIFQCSSELATLSEDENKNGIGKNAMASCSEERTMQLSNNDIDDILALDGFIKQNLSVLNVLRAATDYTIISTYHQQHQRICY